MNSKEILYSDGNNDECYTQPYCVKPILKYIPKDWTVWCPFDTEESNFVKLISKQNKVIHSHISEGKDFYKYQPDEYWDCIISNPPFSGKRKIFERALSFDKPFAIKQFLNAIPLGWHLGTEKYNALLTKFIKIIIIVKKDNYYNYEKRSFIRRKTENKRFSKSNA